MSLRLDIEEMARALRVPLHTAAGVIDVRHAMVLRIWENGECLAAAECAPLPGFSPDTLAECRAAAHSWLHTGDALVEPDFWLRTARSLEGMPALQCAAETLAIGLASSRAVALEDWPPRRYRRIEANAIANDPQAARAQVDAGFRVLKIKVGAATLLEDVRRVNAIRAEVGEALTLRLDANQAWSISDAENAVDVFAPARIALLEEPLAGGTAADLAQLRAYSTIPIGADERARDAESITALLDEAAADIIVLKPMLVGGPLTCIRLAHLANARGTSVLITTTIDGPIATRMAIEVAARVRGPLAHGVATSVLFDDARGYPPIDQGGFTIGDRFLAGAWA